MDELTVKLAKALEEILKFHSSSATHTKKSYATGREVLTLYKKQEEKEEEEAPWKTTPKWMPYLDVMPYITKRTGGSTRHEGLRMMDVSAALIDMQCDADKYIFTLLKRCEDAERQRDEAVRAAKKMRKALKACEPFMEKWLASCDGSTPHEDATFLLRAALAQPIPAGGETGTGKQPVKEG